MTITQTVEIPPNRWLHIEVPSDVPTGPVILSFTPARISTQKSDPCTVEGALQMEKAADPNRKPISRYFGILSPNTYGDGVAYQRKIRDEWDD